MDDGLRGIVPARTKTWPRLALAVGALAGVGYAYWKLAVPEHRVEIRSELVMLGDLDGDRRWTAGDLEALDAFLRDPFAASDALACNVDLNWNGLIDDEDVCVLRALVAARGDPYAPRRGRARGTSRSRDRAISTAMSRCPSTGLGRSGRCPIRQPVTQ